MRQIAKLFMNGRSQAVRLPASFRFDCEQVYIRQDPETGDVILSRKPGSWGDYFAMVKQLDVPQDYMADRDNDDESEKDLF